MAGAATDNRNSRFPAEAASKKGRLPDLSVSFLHQPPEGTAGLPDAPGQCSFLLERLHEQKDDFGEIPSRFTLQFSERNQGKVPRVLAVRGLLQGVYNPERETVHRSAASACS
ncbi:hypothetical protein AOXY_G33366 [Acipenser oxyrinchus oxyrinchus]|uniref:Uncharacterized protein n=1 Tax=Acipenser oxyrinchus oxyrinchus TaxID=40147 RepID=A0AAD8FR47_ACIOX|nr:hypothetical protein AOXY_G33366 [Acipenser oxyrinchus oxyrinchus]